MINSEQLDVFLEKTAASKEVQDLLREIVPGYHEAVELAEKIANDLKTAQATIAEKEQKIATLGETLADNEVKLQKVASDTSESVKKAAERSADVLIDHEVLDARDREVFVGGIVSDPVKFAAAMENVINVSLQSNSNGEGLDRPTPFYKRNPDEPKMAGSELVPLDDPYYQIIYKGA